jgi:hypothetical protein
MTTTPSPGSHPWEFRPGYFLTHFIDTLECGHQDATYAFEAQPWL